MALIDISAIGNAMENTSVCIYLNVYCKMYIPKFLKLKLERVSLLFWQHGIVLHSILQPVIQVQTLENNEISRTILLLFNILYYFM